MKTSSPTPPKRPSPAFLTDTLPSCPRVQPRGPTALSALHRETASYGRPLPATVGRARGAAPRPSPQAGSAPAPPPLGGRWRQTSAAAARPPAPPPPLPRTHTHRRAEPEPLTAPNRGSPALLPAAAQRRGGGGRRKGGGGGAHGARSAGRWHCPEVGACSPPWQPNFAEAALAAPAGGFIGVSYRCIFPWPVSLPGPR